MSFSQDCLFQEGRDLKPAMSAGMSPATRKQLKLASKPARRDPAEKSAAVASVYRRDVILKIEGRRAGPGGYKEAGDVIRGFSNGSRRRLTHLVRNTEELWTGFVTLTYPAEFPTDGRAVKKNINAFCSWLRRKRVAYVWILEFQERGAPHFHFLVSGWLDRVEVAERWTSIVNPVFPSERAKMLAASTRVEGIVNGGGPKVGPYMAKHMKSIEKFTLGAYMAKDDEQKKVPVGFRSVGRFWGASRMIYRLVVELGQSARSWKGEPLNPKTVYRRPGLYGDAARSLRECRKWYSKHCRSGGRGIAFKWKWRGQGFILADGVPLFKSLLRQAVLIDAGRSPAKTVGGREIPAREWKEWGGEKTPAPRFVTLKERLELRGQMLLGGGCDPLHSTYDE